MTAAPPTGPALPDPALTGADLGVPAPADFPGSGGAEAPVAPRPSGPAHAAATPVPSGFRRIAGISASLVGTQALTSVLGLVFWTLAARRFVPVEVGVAGAAVALMMLLGALGSLGLGTVLIARLPDTEPDTRRVLVRTCLLAAGVGGGLLGLIVPPLAIGVFGADNLRPIGGSPLPLLVFALGTALTSVTIVLDQAVLTVGVGGLQLERNVLASVVKIGALVALAATGQTGGMAVFAAWTVGTAVSLPLVAWRTRGGRAGQRHRRLVDLHLLRGMGRLAVSHHALNTSVQAALQVLPVMVTALVSAQQNAFFTTAIMLAGFVFALPYSITIGLFAAAQGDEREVLRRMRLTVPFGLAVSAAADLVLYPLAPWVLSVFGHEYAAGGVTVLRLVVLAGLPFVVKDHFVALRRVQGRTTEAVWVVCAFLVLELAAAAVGAHLDGTVGLCLGWLGVLVVEALILAGLMLRRGPAVGRADRTPVPASAVAAVRAPAAAPPAVTDDQPVERATVARPVGPGRLLAPGPAPERTPAALAAAAGPARNLAGPVLLLMSVGVLVLALAADRGRAGGTGGLASALWIAGQILVFAPAVVRLVAPRTAHRERMVVAVGLALILQFSRLVINPTVFAFHDELIHADTLRQIEATSHLFSQNPLLPVSGYYPGLEVVTDAVVRTTGLSPFVAAVVTLMLARLILVLALIGLIGLVTGSRRAGGVGVLVYVANPQFLFFNSQYSYQTLALPLAVLTLYLFAARRRGRRLALVPPLAGTAAVAFTHHLTALLLIAAFAVWFVLVVVRQRRALALADEAQVVRWRFGIDRTDLLVMVVGGLVAVGVTALNPGNPLRGYLEAIAGSSTEGVTGLTEGRSSKALFADSAGTGPAWWEQALLIGAVLLVGISLLVSLGFVRSRWRLARPLAILFGLTSLLYPLIPAGHLTSATAEVGDRASGFVFAGTAVVIGGWWWARSRTRLVRTGFVVAAVVVFLGDVVLGAGPTSGQLPGPYQISADARSVDADNLAAARYLAVGVPQGSVVYGDRTSGGLAAQIGGDTTVLHVSTGIDASRLLLEPTFTPADVALIRQAHLQYLIVDDRLAQGLPHQQYYIESGEYGGDDRTAPVTIGALEKFASVPGVQRIYDNGALAVYDLRGLG